MTNIGTCDVMGYSGVQLKTLDGDKNMRGHTRQHEY